jgi:hypothetical protein
MAQKALVWSEDTSSFCRRPCGRELAPGELGQCDGAETSIPLFGRRKSERSRSALSHSGLHVANTVQGPVQDPMCYSNIPMWTKTANWTLANAGLGKI